MTLQPRDRRALALLAVSGVLALTYRYWTSDSAPAVVAAVADPAQFAEKRLAKLRDAASTVTAKEAIMKQVSADLAAREKFLIAADTAAQAQAHVIETMRRLTSADSPPIELRQTQIGPVRALSDAYGEVVISVQLECRIDQLVNLLSSLAAQPEMISVTDLRVLSTTSKDKTVGVQLTLAGLVPSRLIPEKSKAAGSRL